ncbi:FxSxx-COOH system tetratricopeptide repeat protein [Streptomyces graminifolii]|uniref:FxSxx-COOH system tetratricopeptide repeat protein n=1 Tax=Streptomyces graminifolii TaxID=1266771 RepID=UPI004058288D
MIAWLQGQMAALTTERERAHNAAQLEAERTADDNIERAEQHLTRTEDELGRARKERAEAEELKVAAQRKAETYRLALAAHDTAGPAKDVAGLLPGVVDSKIAEPSLQDYEAVLDTVSTALDDQQQDLANLRERVAGKEAADAAGHVPRVILGQAEVVRVVRTHNADNADAVAPDPAPLQLQENLTVSYAGFNRPWATWIAHQLEQLGHVTTLLRWDPPRQTSLAEALRNLLEAPGRVLLVLDDWYFSLGPRTDAEWTQALHEVVPPHVNRFSAVSVATRALPATTAPLRPVDLRDLDSREARRRILQHLGLDPAAAPGPVSGTAPRFPNDPPAVWNVPRRNNRFTGRDAILEKLHARFEEGGRGGARVALRGISGVGKSQIAIEYAHRFGNDYDIVWWVGARFRAPAREQFAQLAPRLELPVGQELGERIRAVHEVLRTGRPFRRWLLVLDSADDMEQIGDLLPEDNGHVLITTLTQDWATSGSVTEIEVQPFRRAESVAYARRRAQRLTEYEADDLADAVQDLPLLLAQTAAWLDANVMPAKDYVAMIRRGEASEIGIRLSSDYPMGFQTSWSITLNTLQENNPKAIELLRLFALFNPEAIPVRLIQTAHPADLPSQIAYLASDPLRWHHAVQRLAEATAVQLEYEDFAEGDGPQGRRAQMAKLYQRFLSRTLAPEQSKELSDAACRILAGADPRHPAGADTWTRYAQLVPHLEPSGACTSSLPEVRRLVLNCAEYLKLSGDSAASTRLLSKANFQ